MDRAALTLPSRTKARAQMRLWLFSRLPRLLLLILTLLVLGGTAFFVWYFTRSQPAPIDHQQLFPGMVYTREVRQTPAEQVIHVVDVDLTTPGLHFLVTPANGNADFNYSAHTASEFLTQYHMSLAINGDFFRPFRDNSFLDYYPHEGDGVNIHGYTMSQGQLVSQGYPEDDSPVPHEILYISADNQASFEPIANPYNAVSGSLRLVVEGRVDPVLYTIPVYLERHPRTAVALTKDKTHLIIIVVDGRQPHYSDGASFIELAQIAIKYGAYSAMNMDGGGSSTLVIRDENGNPKVLNSPVHSHIPGNQRPTANQLGIGYDTP